MNAEPNLVFILPVSFIRKQITQRTSKKQNRLSTSNSNQSVLTSLFCGVKDKVINRTTKNSQNRRSLIEPLVDSGSCSEFSSSSNNTKRSLTPEEVVANLNDDGKMNNIKNIGGNSNKLLPSSISSPNLATQDSASSSTSSSNRVVNNDLINLSEEYGNNMAERERRAHEERERRMSGSRGTQTLSSVNGDINRTPKSKKKSLLLQPAPNRDIKPSTILRLEDRDLVVIDKQDIKEAVRNESDVIIVDPPPMTQTPIENDNDQQHADLTEILGNHWPDLAGASGALLNNEKRGNHSNSNGWRTVERNKSANFASHFSSGTKSRTDTQNNGYRKSE